MQARPQRGFVLVIVLALLVVLALLAGIVAASGRQAVTEAQRTVDGFQSDVDMLSTRETVLFMLATQRKNLGGLVADATAPITMAQLDDDADGTLELPTGTEIRLDGTPYVGLGDARFALQDDRGLLNLNWASPLMRAAFYTARGVPSHEWDPLDAKRLDYQDPDSLHRLGGAEADHYRSAGLPPPANRTLATPLEFRRILQWRSMLEPLDDERLLGLLTLAPGSSINLNTASKDLLELIPGMTPEEAERMIALRRQAPFTTVSQVRATFPIAPFLEDGLTLFPNVSGNLILWDRRFGIRRLAHWTLTALQPGGPPWRIDYEVTLPRGKQSDEAVAGTPATPLLATQDPAGQ